MHAEKFVLNVKCLIIILILSGCKSVAVMDSWFNKTDSSTSCLIYDMLISPTVALSKLRGLRVCQWLLIKQISACMLKLQSQYGLFTTAC